LAQNRRRFCAFACWPKGLNQRGVDKQGGARGFDRARFSRL
jgi:hypothetical protein